MLLQEKRNAFMRMRLAIVVELMGMQHTFLVLKDHARVCDLKFIVATKCVVLQYLQ